MDKSVSTPYEHTNEEVAYITSVSGYLTHRLTGRFNDSIGNNFGQLPVDYKTWQWSEYEKEIKKFQIPREMLFKVQMPGTIMGYVTKEAPKSTGFPFDLPVVGVTSDKAVEALGAGLIDGSGAVISLGTYIALMTMGEGLPNNPSSFWTIMSSIPNEYIYKGYGIRRGMWTVSWFKDLLGDSIVSKSKELHISAEEYLSLEAAKVPKVPVGCDGLLTVLDWLVNPWEPYKRGIMIGFNAHNTFAYMYRSILEGIAFTMKNNCTSMCLELNKKLRQVIISGGSSNSDLFMQIFADVFNLPVKRNLADGAASLGAAINTSIAVGAYTNYKEAVKYMVKVKDVFNPIHKNVILYDKLNNEVYKQITKKCIFTTTIYLFYFKGNYVNLKE